MECGVKEGEEERKVSEVKNVGKENNERWNVVKEWMWRAEKNVKCTGQ